MILVLGGRGYLATEFGNFFRRKNIPHSVVSRSEWDYSQEKGLRECIHELKPSFLINAAGYTGIPNVDASESNKSKCLLANTALPSLIAQVCAEENLRWGHLSTGCIYTGSKPDGKGFTENDPPNFSFRQNNCSFYSGTKALAEEILLDYDNVYIWRFRRPFNHIAHPRNYLAKVLSYERQLETTNSITWINDLMDACLICIQDHPATGIYNITNPGAVKTSEIIRLLEAHQLNTSPFSFFASEEEFYDTGSRTPRSECLLDSNKIQSLGVEMKEVHEALEFCCRTWHSSPHEEAKV